MGEIHLLSPPEVVRAQGISSQADPDVRAQTGFSWRPADARPSRRAAQRPAARVRLGPGAVRTERRGVSPCLRGRHGRFRHRSRPGTGNRGIRDPLVARGSTRTGASQVGRRALHRDLRQLLWEHVGDRPRVPRSRDGPGPAGPLSRREVRSPTRPRRMACRSSGSLPAFLLARRWVTCWAEFSGFSTPRSPSRTRRVSSASPTTSAA